MSNNIMIHAVCTRAAHFPTHATRNGSNQNEEPASFARTLASRSDVLRRLHFCSAFAHVKVYQVCQNQNEREVCNISHFKCVVLFALFSHFSQANTSIKCADPADTPPPLATDPLVAPLAGERSAKNKHDAVLKQVRTNWMCVLNNRRVLE